MILALEWAARGVPVFPCRPDDRVPMVKDGVYEATTDPEIIRAWWRKFPHAIVGIACGAECFDVIDCDCDKDTGETIGENYIRSEFPHAWGLADVIVSTPSGGRHLLFKPGSKLKNFVKSVEGCDVRTDGGYVIAAGNPGYAFHRGGYDDLDDLQKPPDDLLAALWAKHNEDDGQHEDGHRLTVDEITPEIRAYVESAIHLECEAVRNHTEGGRNHQLNEAAFKLGTLVGAGVLEYDRAAEALTEAALDVGLGKDETRKTVKSGLQSGQKKPRDLSDVGEDKLGEFLDRYVYIETLDAVADLWRPESSVPIGRVAFLVSTSAHVHIVPTHAPIVDDPTRMVDKWVPVGGSWLSHPDRKTVEGLCYRPGKGRICSDGLNVYENPNYIESTAAPPAVWFEFLEMLAPEKEDRDLLARWMAHTLHKPERRSPITPLLITTHEGVGKGIFARIVSRLCGRSNTSYPKMHALLGEFNEFLYRTTFGVVDEVAEGLDGRSRFVAMDSLRDALTEPWMRVNVKRISGRTERVFTNLLLLSNHEDALAIREADRRLFVITSHTPPAPAEFYNRVLRITPGRIAEWLKPFAAEPLPNRAPLNESKRRMIDASVPEWVETVADLLHDKNEITMTDLSAALYDSGTQMPADRALAREMARLGFSSKRVRHERRQVRMWVRGNNVIDLNSRRT